MATAVQLELQGDAPGGNFTFALDGPYFPRLEGEYKTAAAAPQLVALREVWEIRGAKIVGADPAATWAAWVAFRARIASTRSGSGGLAPAFPTYARFVIPGGATLYTIGPSTHEGFLVELVESDPRDLRDEEQGGAWRTVVPVTLRVSAIQKFADTNGIVGWEQEVFSTYPEGRHRLEWRTRITTAEGTNAADKAASYAAIDTDTLDGTYLYETNGPDGVDVQTLDADEQNSRTPTVAIATSVVRSFGTTIGSVLPGASPSDVSYSITTRTTAKERVTTTSATATGPNALQYVESKEPAVYNESEVVDEQAKMFASGVWSQREETQSASGDRTGQGKTGIAVAVSGGSQAIDFEAVADDGDPVAFFGAWLPVAATVDIKVEAVGPTFDKSSMQLPGAPGDGWALDSAASSEGEPQLTEEAASPSGNKWTRTARLVFRRHGVPSQSRGLLALISEAPKVPTHLGRT